MTTVAPLSSGCNHGCRSPALAAQMRRACDRAGVLVAQSLLLRHLRAASRGRRALVCRCAWCERFRLDGRWLSLAEVPPPPAVEEHLTHGICPDCFADLEQSGSGRR
jgi:hypothetical protein